MATWLFAVTDRLGNAYGELQDADNRNVNLLLDQITTGSFSIRTDNPLVNVLRQADQTFIKAYRNGVLLGHGPCVPGYQKQVDIQTKNMTVNWAGVGWRLGHRLIPASFSSAGVSYPANAAAGGTMDRGQMAVAIINDLNSQPLPSGISPQLADTGIRIGSVPATTTTGVGPWYYQNALTAINQLSATLDGFDWEIAPTEPTPDATGLQLGTFNCAAAIGSYKQEVVFEYGDGKNNVASFTETGDFTGALNSAYSLPPGFPDAATQPVLSFGDAAAVVASGTIYSDVIAGDLTVDDMRNRLLVENVTVRKVPKRVVTFVPSNDLTPGVVPQFGTDFIVGDTFQFRAVEFGVETINAIFRCYGVQFSVDAQGNETATPVLISQDG